MITNDRQEPQPGTSDGSRNEGSKHQQLNQQLNNDEREARNRVEKLILDAEMFKASISTPQGMVLDKNDVQNSVNGIENLERSLQDRLNFNGSFPQTQCNPGLDGDDDFFHLTCHIEPNLRVKIERGEFVDLEKLLPKDKLPHVLGNDNKMEMVSRDGATYFVPAADKDAKISNLRKMGPGFQSLCRNLLQNQPS